MNDTTLPIPPQKKRANPRRRGNGGVVRRGFGLHDWMNLLRRSRDLAQRRGAPIRKDITLAEVRGHDKPYDGWVVLRGKVYNIAPYMAYHPGGSEILERSLGADATALFDKYHSWVSLDGLIGPLLMGYLEVEKRTRDDEDGEYFKGVVGSSLASIDENENSAVSTAASTVPAATDRTLEGDISRARLPGGTPMASLLPREDEKDEEEEHLF